MKNDTDELFDKVINWGKLHAISNPICQFAKINEEIGEIAHELTRDRLQSSEMVDAIGDALVTLIIFTDILGFDLQECLQVAYDAIKDRKGVTKNGNFIKEENERNNLRDI